jgi:tetratricopeptide (TPR) repeat protein
LLVEYFKELPEPQEGEQSETWSRRQQSALTSFKRKVAQRYTEGTLQRLVQAGDRLHRRAAAFALGLLGSFSSSQLLAERLKDDDPVVRQLAEDALWSIWFRADTPAHCQELQKLRKVRDPQKALAGLNALIHKAPNFAEAYNQRAILYFRLEEYPKSLADCERVLQLNPLHFGAQAGMGQCYLKLKKPKAALKALRGAFRINPNLQGVEETIRALEEALGEEKRKDDLK